MKTILVDAAHTFVIKSEHGFTIFKEMQEILDKFPNRKIILTGANDEQFRDFGLDKMPYEVFTLKHNPEKSNPEYYRKMLEHFNLHPENLVYFEHDPEAVQSARSVGIKTHFWDDTKRPLDELVSFLQQNV